jgi:hypothetical protein
MRTTSRHRAWNQSFGQYFNASSRAGDRVLLVGPEGASRAEWTYVLIMRRQFAARPSTFSPHAYLLDNQKPMRCFLKREWVASGKSEGMRSQSLFDKQADYQLDALDAATEALHRAVITRMLSAKTGPR